MAAPDLLSASSIYGQTTGAPLNTSVSGILTCASNKVYKVNNIMVSNVDGSSAADTTVQFYDSSKTAAYSLATTLNVPPDTTVVIVGESSRLYLEESDEVRASASANGDLEIVVSYEEIS